MTTIPCEKFKIHVETFFSDFLAQHSFHYIECQREGEGRWESICLKYCSDTCSMLFTFYDGSYDVSLGAKDTPLPHKDIALSLDGSQGWYNILLLIEFVTKKPSMTQKIIDQIWAGTLNQFAFELDQLEAHKNSLFALFNDSKTSWTAEFTEFLEHKMKRL